jgi:two-component system, LytTR family, sensor kinase
VYSKKKLNKKRIFWQVFAWMIFIAIGALKNSFVRPGFKMNVPDIIFTELPNVYIFYLQCFIFLNFLNKKKLLLFCGIEILFICSYYLLAYLDAIIIAPLLNPNEINLPIVVSEFMISGLWAFLIYTFFATGYFFATSSIQKEKNLRIAESERLMKYEENMLLQKQNLILEREKLDLKKERIEKEQQHLQTEYAFLRSQINPHFLHNTLNFFYAKSLTGNTKELSEAILTLSEIMRYSLQKEETGTTEVLLSDEINHIGNVIKINQLRFSNTLNIVFSIKGNIENIRIIPLVLITLIENAFKHGELNNQIYPLEISLLVNSDAQLHFSVVNKKKTGPKELSHGIGINNIRRRLDIAYPQRYLLEATDDETQYKVKLIIQFGSRKQLNASTKVAVIEPKTF